MVLHTAAECFRRLADFRHSVVYASPRRSSRPPHRVEAAVDELVRELGELPNWGVNLIHSPNEPAVEERVAELLITRGVPIVSASAFMGLTPAVVRCAVAGLRTDADGRIVRRTR